VDDWEYVTKNMQLVPLPSKTPVNTILDTYFVEEKGKRRLGSAEADLLEEVVAGAKEYFDRTLGKLLLYRFERQQYLELRQNWDASTEQKGAGDVYGAEHLIRMIGELSLFLVCVFGALQLTLCHSSPNA
jgi:mortality factor 4-like protein 1